MSLQTLKTTLYNWVSRTLSKVDYIDLTMDSDFFTGNTIVVTFNGSDLPTLPFNTDNDTTLQDIADQIAGQPEVASATIAGTAPSKHEINIIGVEGQSVVINMIAVTVADPLTETAPVLQTNVRYPTASTPVEKVIFYNPKRGVQPAQPYVTLQLFNFVRRHDVNLYSPEEIAPDEYGQRTEQLWEFTLTIQSYGTGANQILLDLEASTNKIDIISDLLGGNISTINTEQIIDISDIEDSEIEARYSLDLRLLTSIDLVDSDGFEIIETVETPVGTLET